MVSKASEDLPDPDRPVSTVRVSRGLSTSIFLRLCARAPRMEMFFSIWVSGCGSDRALEVCRKWGWNPYYARITATVRQGPRICWGLTRIQKNIIRTKPRHRNPGRPRVLHRTKISVDGGGFPAALNSVRAGTIALFHSI